MNLLRVNSKQSAQELIMTVLVPVLTGFLAFLLIENRYQKTPVEGFSAFNAVTALSFILLVLMGVSSYRAKLAAPASASHIYYALQLLLLFLWHILFFRFENAKIGFGLIVANIFLLVLTFFEFEKIDKRSGYLIFPGIIWVLALAVYNFYMIK